MKEGLKPMNRQYVHLSQDKETAYLVGSRHDQNSGYFANRCFIKLIKMALLLLRK